MLHALCVLNWPKDVDGLVVRTPEGLQAFVTLLSIVQARCHAMDPQEGIFDKLGLRPFARFDTVVGFDMPIDLADTEADVAPVCVKQLALVRWSKQGYMPHAEGSRLTNGVDWWWRECRSHWLLACSLSPVSSMARSLV